MRDLREMRFRWDLSIGCAKMSVKEAEAHDGEAALRS
jgi:hypothetical protein